VGWLLGAAVLPANWPYTIFVIMPTYHHRPMNTPPGAATAETRSMIGRGAFFTRVEAPLDSRRS
jgi:hypothetical protein